MTAAEAQERLVCILNNNQFTKADKKAMYLAINAINKQIPKKPRETRCALMCASCGHKITEKGCKKLNRNYCKKCGQRIFWEDE
jgi:hypothetical protein